MKSGTIDYVVKSATVFKDLPHIARRALRDWENIRQRMQAGITSWARPNTSAVL
jgi:hypothetical protein